MMFKWADGTPTAAFYNQNYIFGSTDYQQRRRWEQEINAYFCLVTPATILEQVHITREFDIDDNLTDTWLQSVNVM